MIRNTTGHRSEQTVGDYKKCIETNFLLNYPRGLGSTPLITVTGLQSKCRSSLTNPTSTDFQVEGKGFSLIHELSSRLSTSLHRRQRVEALRE